MRDLFDEFMEELRRREAIGRGEDPDRAKPRRVSPDEDPPEDDDDEPRSSDDSDDQDAGGSGGRVPPRRPRSVGGPDDGDRVIGGPSGRQVVLIAFAIVLIGLFLVSSTLIDLSTDAL